MDIVQFPGIHLVAMTLSYKMENIRNREIKKLGLTNSWLLAAHGISKSNTGVSRFTY